MPPPPLAANCEKNVELLKSLGATFKACCFFLFLCVIAVAVPNLLPEPPLVEDDAGVADPVDVGGFCKEGVERRNEREDVGVLGRVEVVAFGRVEVEVVVLVCVDVGVLGRVDVGVLGRVDVGVLGRVDVGVLVVEVGVLGYMDVGVLVRVVVRFGVFSRSSSSVVEVEMFEGRCRTQEF